MISQHRSTLATTLTALALLGWLAVDQAGDAHAGAARSARYVDDAVKHLQQRYTQATVIQLKNALREDPDNAEVRRILGEIYLNQQRFPYADKELKRAHELGATPDGVILLGRALLGQGKTEETLELIDDTPSADADQSRALALLKADTLLGLERLVESREAIATLLETNPLNIDIGLTDARISLAERDIEAAKIKVGQALEIDPESTQAWMLDVQIKSGEGRYEDALASLDKLAELAPGNDRVKVMRAEVLIRRAKFDDAERMVTDVLNRQPADVAANFLLATVQSNKGDLEAADATLGKITDLTRDVDEATLLSGVVKLGIGQHAQAETLLAKYISRAPQNLPVRRLLAGPQLQQGSSRAAIDTLRPVTGPGSTDVISLQLRSSAEIQIGNIVRARDTLVRLASLGRTPSAAQAATLLSVLNSRDDRIPSDQARIDMARILDLVRNGQGDQAFAAAKASNEQLEDNPFVLSLFGMTHMVSGSDEQAARLTSKVLIEKNEGGQAIAVLEQALAETPSPAITRALFSLRQKLGLEEEAVLELKSWVATNPDDVGALDLLGDANVARQEFDAAFRYFERAHQLTLNDPVLMNDLRWVRFELGRPGAQELARRAYQMSQNPAISDTLGWILVQKGESEDGVLLLREAHRGLQHNPDIRFHLAYALHSQGDVEGANALLRDLKDWPQPFMERERPLELLEQLKSS